MAWVLAVLVGPQVLAQLAVRAAAASSLSRKSAEVAVYDVNIFEPIHPIWTADSTAVTADSVVYTADGGPLAPATDQTYAAVNANVLFADIYEPVASPVTADTTLYTADNTIWPTADGGILEGARDATDAEVISAELPV